jgi:hypothetical protein
VRRVAICWLLAACGRLGFDETGDARSDGTDVIAACARNPSAPDPLAVTGTTFRYMAFDNSTRTLLSGVSVTAYDADVGTQLATTTSDAGGGYTLVMSTGGTPPRVRLVYTVPSHFQTEVTIDRSVDRDVSGANAQVWSVGDGPLWNLAGMTSFYSTASVPRDTTRGTLNISIRDCGGQPVAGVMVSVSPPPAKMLYQADDGSLVTSGETLPKFATVFGVNALAGPNTISVTAPGLTFPPMTVDVGADQFNTLVILHADPP